MQTVNFCKSCYTSPLQGDFNAQPTAMCHSNAKHCYTNITEVRILLPILDERLAEISKLVRHGKVTCDVGTDHGFLITYLVGSGIVPLGFACDINEKPLQSAIKTTEKYGAEKQINCILTDGLYGLDNKNIEEVIIAGMGGDLIWDIVKKADWVRDKSIHLILQPMTKANHLRKSLYAGGFEIEYENAVVSGRFVYTVMSVYFTGKCRDIDLLESFIGKVIEGGSKDTINYLERMADNMKERADGMMKSDTNSNKSTVYYKLYDEILELIEKTNAQKHKNGV